MTTILGTEVPDNDRYPWWVRAIYRLGVPAALLVFLVWFLAGRVSADQQRTIDMLQQHMSTMSSEQEELRRLLSAVCVNVAKDQAAIDRCFD